MKRTIIMILMALMLHIPAWSQYDSQNKKLNRFIEYGMKDWKIPGLSALVVKDGQVVFKQSYGIKDIETKEKVDNQTMFNMASTTKAIIAISMGMLVDEGKMAWDDPVVQHYPKFKLSDPYITADARIRDLLTHNLGIGNQDLLWVFDSTSTDEVIRRFQKAPRSYPLRGGYTYQNIMYAIAGEVIREVSGMYWMDFVVERVFSPLEMTRSVTRSKEIFEKGNYTSPHWNDYEDGLVKVPFTLFDQIGAAGIIWSCIDDMGNYMTFLLNEGVVNGDTLLKPETFDYLFKPHSFVTDKEFYPTQQLTNPNWKTYGLGWFQHDYKGQKLNFHTGSISGLVALAAIIPEKNIGVYVFANMDHAELRHAIMYKVLDLYLYNDDSRDWHQEIFKLYSGFRKESIAEIEEMKKSRIEGTVPAVPLDSLTGQYNHDQYGSITIDVSDQKLQINVNDIRKYDADHWHYNTFITNKDARWRNRMLINFIIATNGRVNHLEIDGIGNFVKK